MTSAHLASQRDCRGGFDYEPERMQRFRFPEWADDFVLTRELRSPADRAHLRRRRESGELERVLTGAYFPAEALEPLNPEQRHLVVMRAAALTANEPLVFAQQSAAVAWRLPLVGRLPDRAHVSAPPQGGGRSTQSLIRHTSSRPLEIAAIDGLQATSLARTVIDLAARAPFDTAVVAADAALRRAAFPLSGVPRTPLTRDDLRRELLLLPRAQGTVRARLVVNFADARAQLPGESLSRVNMLRAGIPAPSLQAELRGASGKRYFADFSWTWARLIGEFDGEAKYSDPGFLEGRTPHRALLDEKEREDDLRLAGYRMCRWNWATARDPRALRALLLRAGLTPPN
ncbi:hypothetical protein FVA74_13165 [Salinibacterium sp. dk2585]|uniref:hypothetical protein n=1 Tax=unclassified Salinibacterium TaxID=2632331 RepID=UPI0011C24D8F|nr:MULTISPECIES: hypothetical protein [unclassified Salinibacterium]QEE62416.1 hypothetical protein FVA74_13165 [Salinibacterium sp. dk2585]TXK52701.1 hypothetical protein FVP63_12230 [Salinibacterium sp. dk5596]